jgi:oligoendopeptidase F
VAVYGALKYRSPRFVTACQEVVPSVARRPRPELLSGIMRTDPFRQRRHLNRATGPRLFAALLAALSLCATIWFVDTQAQERDRASIADRYKWNLADLYPSLDAWRQARAQVESRLAEIGKFKGRLSSSAATVADALDTMYSVDQQLSRVFVYAGLLADQDTRDATHQGMRQDVTQLAARVSAEASYIEPEILRIGKPTLDKFIATEKRLGVYRFYLEDIARRAPHTLSDAEEKILADAGPLATAPSNVYGILANADFPYPTVTLSDGKSVEVDQAGFNLFRQSPNRADREKVMSAFFGSLGGFSRTYGTTMNSEVQKVLFFMKSRKYPSALALALDGANIPESVYTRLIDGVNKALPSFHRYLKLRKRLMGVDQLHYYDLYAPLVASVNLEYTPEEAEKHILQALAPLGADYVSVLNKAFSERWIDMYPTEGKRSGAYSWGVYDAHPYMLINYNGKYDDMSTVAHELGHTMHSYYSSKMQPYPLSSYHTFVAEVASTFNEALLIDHMLKTISDPKVRLSLLGNYLEGIKGTVFRQTQFAEFELRMYEIGQKGEPITGDALAKLYMDITKKYYGHDQGVTVVDDYVAHEWSFIPHFYRDFYVFQYATSFTASSALASKVKTGDPEALKRYLAFLGSGGSKYPIELLQDAGVDMTSDEPLDLTIKEMNRVMDEMEKLISR